MCVTGFKKFHEADFNSDQVIFFFTALELLMYSWASPHRHGYECLSSHACRRKYGGRCRVSLAGVAQSGVEPQ